MNSKVAKKIRKIISFKKDDPIVRRTYRSIKDEYDSLSPSDRKKYLINLEKLFNN